MNRSTQRSIELDFLRVVAITMMIVYHAAYDLAMFHDWKIDVLGRGWMGIAHGSAALFLFLVGFSFELSWRSSPRYGKYFLRGLRIIGYGLVVSIATYLFDPGTFVRFGILHLIGVMILLLPMLRPLGLWNIALAALIFGGGSLTGTVDTSLLLPLGWVPHRFISVDYYPMIPWSAFTLLGLVIAQRMLRHGSLPSVLPSDTRFARTMTLVSRHSLLIYMAHQPLLMILFRTLIGDKAA